MTKFAMLGKEESRGTRIMSEADEMFEEIGYEKIENKSRDKLTYRYKMGKNKYYEIVFDLLLKQIKIQRTDFCFFTHIQYCGILLEDLKAINKKVEELRW